MRGEALQEAGVGHEELHRAYFHILGRLVEGLLCKHGLEGFIKHLIELHLGVKVCVIINLLLLDTSHPLI